MHFSPEYAAAFHNGSGNLQLFHAVQSASLAILAARSRVEGLRMFPYAEMWPHLGNLDLTWASALKAVDIVLPFYYETSAVVVLSAG